MERHVTLFFTLFMQASAVTWLCLYTAKDSLKYPFGRVVSAFFAIYAVFSVGYSFIPPVNVLAVVVVVACIAVGGVGFCLASGEKRGKLMFVLFISFSQLFLCNTVWTLLSDLVRLTSRTAYDQTRWYNIVFLGLPLLVFLPVFTRLLRNMWRNAAGLNQMPWLRLAAIPATFILVYIATYVLRVMGHDDMVTWHVMLTVTTICFLTTCSQLIFGLSQAAQSVRYAENLRMAEKQNELQGRRFAEMNAHGREVKHLRHDMRQHIAAVYSLLAEKNYSRAEAYAAAYMEENQEITLTPVCDNEVADTVIRYYMALAEQDGVVATVDVVLPTVLPGVTDTDLCVLLGNLFENALNACRQLQNEENRWVELWVAPKESAIRKTLLVSVRNSFNGRAITDKEGNFLSTKSDEGGLGLSSVRAVAEKYQGVARFHAEGRVFCSEVILYGKKPGSGLLH